MKRIAAASIAVMRGGHFLLVKRGRGAAKGQYAFPGGRCEPGETAEQAAGRELLEETGLVAGALKPHKRVEIDGVDFIFELDVFVCLDAAGEAVAGDDAETAGWYNLAQMAMLDVTPSTLEIASEIAASYCGPKLVPLDDRASILHEGVTHPMVSDHLDCKR